VVFLRKFVLIFLSLLALVSLSSAATPSQNLFYPLNGTCPATDYSSNNLAGTCQGSPTTGVDEIFDTGYSFDGSNDEIVVNRTTELEPENMTVALTFRPNELGTDDIASDEVPTLYEKREGANDLGYGAKINDNQLGSRTEMTFVFNNADSNHKIVVNLTEDKWHHVVATYAPGNFKVWLNGTLVNSKDQYGGTVNHSTSRDLHLATDSFGGGRFFNGSIGSFQILDQGVNDSQAQTLYNQETLDSSSSNSAPTASFTVNTSSINEGETVGFDASGSSDSDGSISSYEWDFDGDGSYEGSGQTTEHTYLSSGDYDATLRVTDNDGATDTDSQTISVSSTSEPPSEEGFFFDMDDSSGPLDNRIGESGTVGSSVSFQELGFYNYSLGFDGSSDSQVSYNPSSAINLDDGFTVAAWINKNTSENKRSVIRGVDGSGNLAGYIQLYGGACSANPCFVGGFQDQSGNFHAVNKDVSSIPDSWVHMLVTYDGSNLELYVNNTLEENLSVSATPNQLSEASIAQETDGSFPFSGRIDETYYLNHSVSESEVTDIYQDNYYNQEVLSVSLDNPIDGQNFDAKSKVVDFNWSQSTGNTLENTTLYGNFSGTWSENKTFQLSGSSSSTSHSINLSEGTYKWGVKTFDNESSVTSENRTFTIEKKPLTKEFLWWSDTHFSNNEGDGAEDDIADAVEVIKQRNPDFGIHYGDLTSDGKDTEFDWYWGNISEIKQNTGIERMWATPGESHDAFEDKVNPASKLGGEDVGWNWLDQYNRRGNQTGNWYTIREGNNVFIMLSAMAYPSDTWSGMYDNSRSTVNTEYRIMIPKHKVEWFKEQMKYQCSKDRNIFVATHDPFSYTNIYTHEWWGANMYSWRNTTKQVNDVMRETCPADVVQTGHVHTDADAYYSGNQYVAGGSVLWSEWYNANIQNRDLGGKLPNTTYMQMPVINYEHGAATNNPDADTTYPWIGLVNFTQGESKIEVKALDVTGGSGSRVGWTYNDTTATVDPLTLQLDHPIDFGNNSNGNKIDGFNQSWTINRFSDESADTQWYKPNGFWTNKSSAWIESRFRYNSPKSFNSLRVDWNESTEGCCSLSHRFRSTNSSTLDGWTQWYDNVSNVPSGNYWSINTSISTSSSVTITEMELQQSSEDTTPPNSSDNWTSTGFVDKSEVTVRLNASDNQGGSGVANISYRVNDGSYSTVSGNKTDVPINTQGNNTLEYYATDSAGNQESTNTEYVALGETYVEINDSVNINQTSNNAFINVTKAFNVSNLTVYDDATNFGGINWTISGDTNERIDVKLSWFNDDNIDGTYLANYSVSTAVGNVVTSTFVPRPVDSVYQIYKNGSFFKQVQSDSSKIMDFGYEEVNDLFTSFTVERTDNFRPEFNSTTYILDDVNNQERLEFVLWTRGQNDLDSASGNGTRTEFTNSSLKYDVSLPLADGYKVTDTGGLSRTRNIDLSKNKSGIVDDSSYSHNLSSQKRFQELNITNSESLPVNYTWNSSLGGDLVGQVQGNSVETVNDSSTGDFLNDQSYPFQVETGEIVLGFNYTGWNQLEVENTVSNGFTDVSTVGAVSSITGCSRTNNTAVNVVGGSTENFSLGRTCNPGNKGNPTQDIVNISDNKERIWYNSTDMTINTNYTENNSIVIRADKSDLKNPDNRDGGSLKAIVEGTSSDNSNELNVTDTGSFFRVTVGDSFQASSLHTDDSDWSVTYTLSAEDTEVIGGGGGGSTQPTTDEQTIYFGQDQTQDGVETFNVPFNETSVRNLTITNPSQESLTAELVTGSEGVCSSVSVRPTLNSDSWSGSGTYDVPAASPNQLGTIQDATVDTQIRFELPARSELESQGVTEFSCEFQTASSYGVAEPLVAQVEAPLSLGGILDSLGLGQELCITVPYATLDGDSDPREVCQPLVVWLLLAAGVLVLLYLLYLAWRGKI